jgi:pyrroline-5-carboxylate reductase
VTTPGGCTEIGNNILINSKVEDILFKTIKRTMDKAKKLGG